MLWQRQRVRGEGVWWNHQQFVSTMMGSLLCLNISKCGPWSNQPLASVLNLWHKHTCKPWPPVPQRRPLLTSWDAVILSREHNWVKMSVLCVRSDMTPGCSSGVLSTLTEGFILQSHWIVHYNVAFLACFMNIIDRQGMSYVDIQLTCTCTGAFSVPFPSVSALGYTWLTCCALGDMWIEAAVCAHWKTWPAAGFCKWLYKDMGGS